jgi:hypothetical protein
MRAWRWVVAFAVAAILSGPLAAAPGPEGAPRRAPRVFRPPPEQAELTGPQKAFLKALQLVPAWERQDVVVLDGDVLLQSHEAVNVSPTLQGPPIVLGGQIDASSPRGFTWVGSDPASGDHAVLTKVGESVAGTIWSGDEVFDVRPLGDGLLVAVRLDPRRFPSEHGSGAGRGTAVRTDAAASPPGVASTPAPSLQLPCPGCGCLLECPGPPDPLDAECGATVPASPVTITVLAACTRAAASSASAAGDLDGAEAKLRSALEVANQAYRDSGVMVKLELAHLYAADYSESSLDDCSCLCADLARLAGAGDGFLDELHDYRAAYAADIAVLLTGSTLCPGISYELPPAASAFAVVSLHFAANNYSLAHEIGHLQGAQHRNDGRMAAFKCGHGYCYQDRHGGFFTIMTTSNECALPWPLVSRRIARFSNPEVTYGERPTGDANYDNAKVLNTTAGRLAAFRIPGNVAVSPSRLWLLPGQRGKLTVAAVRGGGPVARAPVQARVTNSGVASARPWQHADTNGRAEVPIRGVHLGATSVEVRAEGAVARVFVVVLPGRWVLAVAAAVPGFPLVFWLGHAIARKRRGGGR